MHRALVSPGSGGGVFRLDPLEGLAQALDALGKAPQPVQHKAAPYKRPRSVQTRHSRRERQVAKFRDEIARRRTEIRVLKQTLVSDSRLPSKAAIQKQLELQQQIEVLESGIERFGDELDEFSQLAEDWSRVLSERSRLPPQDTSSEDREKLDQWSTLLQDQLEQYDFRSLPIEAVSISKETYRPLHEGFDLPSNISASDFIGVIWSYLTGLLELARVFDTNHPGLLILDEPKQQSTKELSFEALLRRASEAGRFGDQIIFATSESPRNLARMLEEIPHTHISFEGRMIRPLQD